MNKILGAFTVMLQGFVCVCVVRQNEKRLHMHRHESLLPVMNVMATWASSDILKLVFYWGIILA